MTLDLYVDQSDDGDDLALDESLAGGRAIDVRIDQCDVSPGEPAHRRAPGAAPVQEVDHEP